MSGGVNLIGYARYEMGIGESCRLAARALRSAGIPLGVYNFSGGCSSRSEDLSLAADEIDAPQFGVNLIHVNADQMPVAYDELGEAWFGGRFNIGYWHWELPEFPAAYAHGFRHLDEVWVPSEFVRASVAARSPVPVVRIPHGVRVDVPPGFGREAFGLPARKFVFLCMYDTFSYQTRKNPLAVIDAYRLAVRRFGLPAALVVKMNNPNPAETARLREATADLPDVRLIDRVLSRGETNALLAAADGYVSLHRAEGFGLPLAESMALGKPVIATHWSGNVDFMTPDNAGTVRYELKRLGRDYGPYEGHQWWAEPDAEHAAYLMWRLVRDEAWRRRIAAEGQRTVRTAFSPEAAGRAMRERLTALGLLGPARRRTVAPEACADEEKCGMMGEKGKEQPPHDHP